MTGRIIIQRDRVIKSGDPHLMGVEVEKTRRGGMIGRASGLFRVPRVIDYNPERGVAVFEKIDNLISFRQSYIFNDVYRSAAQHLGAALAVIHRELTLPDETIIPLPTELAGPGREVFLHGDFSVDNICRDGDDRLVIIDWQMTVVHGGRATRGTPCFDLIWFVNNLFYRPTLRHFRTGAPLSVARSFLEGYYHASSEAPSPAMLADYADRFFSFKRSRRGANANRRERPLLFLSHHLARIFVRELRRGRVISG